MPRPPSDAEQQTGSRPRGIQSIEIGYKILTAIQQGPGAVPLKTVAARASMSASAVHNYLASFIRVGMVCADMRGQYRLGPSLTALGMSAATHVDHFELVRTRATELSDQTGLGVAVLIWGAQGPIIMFNKPDPRNRTFALRNGPVAMLTTAAGHVFATYLDRSLTLPVAMAERTGDTEKECSKTLDAISGQVLTAGYADVMLGGLSGYGAVSTPIWDAQNSVAYALTITAPVELIDKDPQAGDVATLLNATRELSRLLGAPPKRWAPPEPTTAAA